MPDSQTQVSVSLVEGRPATTSLKIAEHFGKNHKDVLRDIRILLDSCPEEFGQRNFAPSSYQNEQGKEQPMYTVYFDGFILLVMGYTGKKALTMKLAYIGAFNAMREKLEAKTALPQSDNPDMPIGPADQNTLQAIVRAKVAQMPEASSRGGFPQIWSRFNNHFRLGSYKQLPQSKMAEAVEYLVKLEVHEPKAFPGQMALPASGDKFVAYIHEVEAFRQKTVAGMDALVQEGLQLVDVYKFGPGCMSPFTSALVDWLQKVTVSVSPIISGFHTSERVLDYCPIGIFREMEKDYEWCRGRVK